MKVAAKALPSSTGSTYVRNDDVHSAPAVTSNENININDKHVNIVVTAFCLITTAMLS